MRTKPSRDALYVRAIARASSISTAADVLGISQPALSSYLKKLESEYGVSLFDRASKPLSLTDAGRAFLDFEDEVDRLQRDFERKLSDIENLRTGHLVIGGSSSFNLTYYPEAIARFTHAYPGISVTLVDDTAPNLAVRALRGELDLFISPATGDMTEFECEELIRERVVLCLPRGWGAECGFPKTNDDFAFIDVADFAKLGGKPFISLHENQQIGNMLRHLLDESGCIPGNTVIVEQTITGLALTISGVGASLATEQTIKQSQASGLVERYRINSPMCERSLFVAFPANGNASRAARKFTELLISVFKGEQTSI